MKGYHYRIGQAGLSLCQWCKVCSRKLFSPGWDRYITFQPQWMVICCYLCVCLCPQDVGSGGRLSSEDVPRQSVWRQLPLSSRLLRLLHRQLRTHHQCRHLLSPDHHDSRYVRHIELSLSKPITASTCFSQPITRFKESPCYFIYD